MDSRLFALVIPGRAGLSFPRLGEAEGERAKRVSVTLGIPDGEPSAEPTPGNDRKWLRSPDGEPSAEPTPGNDNHSRGNDRGTTIRDNNASLRVQ